MSQFKVGLFWVLGGIHNSMKRLGNYLDIRFADLSANDSRRTRTSRPWGAGGPFALLIALSALYSSVFLQPLAWAADAPATNAQVNPTPKAAPKPIPAPNSPPPSAKSPQSAGSYADSSGTTPGNPWFNPDDPNCKQGCTYSKANENLILLLLYTQEKYATIRDAMDSGTPEGENLALASMGKFCSGGESVHDCWGRFKRFTLIEEARYRKAIIDNESAQARLLSKRGTAGKGGKVEGEDVPVVAVVPLENAAPRAPIVPYLPSYDELKKRRESENTRLKQMKGAVTAQFEDWVKDYPLAPSEADFALTKRILRDPDDPARGYFTVVDTERAPDGTEKAKIDKAAYKAALLAYHDAVVARGGPKGKGPTQMQMDKAVYEARLKARMIPSPTPLALPSGDPNRRAYNNARGRVVDHVNAYLGREYKLKDASAPRIQVKLKPKPSPSPSGDLAKAKPATPAAKSAPGGNTIGGTANANPVKASKLTGAFSYDGTERVGTIIQNGSEKANDMGIHLPLERERNEILRDMIVDVGGKKVRQPGSAPAPRPGNGSGPVLQVNEIDLPSISPED